MDLEFKMDQALRRRPFRHEQAGRERQKRFAYYVKNRFLRRHNLLLLTYTHKETHNVCI